MLASLVFHLLSSACSSTDADRCCTLFLSGLSPCPVQALFVSAARDSTCKFSDLAALIFSAKPPPVSSIFVLSYSAFFLLFFPFFSPRRFSGMYTDTEDPQSNMLRQTEHAYWSPSARASTYVTKSACSCRVPRPLKIIVSVAVT